MDSQIKLDWFRASIIDNSWRSEALQAGEINLPQGELPELDTENVPVLLTTKQPEPKWPDNGLQTLLALAK